MTNLLDVATKGVQGKRTDLLYNIQEVKAPTGTSKEAGLRRLRKDAPEIHDRVLAGELSVNKGMIEAGFRKVPTGYEKLPPHLVELLSDAKRLVEDPGSVVKELGKQRGAPIGNDNAAKVRENSGS